MCWARTLGSVSAPVSRLVVQEVDFKQPIGQVPLHGALRVSREAMLLYCSGNVVSQPCAQLQFHQNDDLHAHARW